MSGLVIAVTGTTAFFGRDLLVALESDPSVAKIIALDSKPPPTEGPKTTWHKVDLIHPRSGERLSSLLQQNDVDVLIHTAFLARPVHKGGWAHELEAIGTKHVLAAVAAAGTHKLILRSTTLAYGADPSHPNYLREASTLKGGAHSAFIRDKVEVETQTAQFAQKHPDRVVTILRFAPLVGPRADTLASTYLSGSSCPVLMGFDPLVQLLHAEDAIGATVATVHKDVRGAINIGAPGVLPLSQVVKLAGKTSVPLPRILLRPLAETLWTARLGDFPPGMVDFLKYLCVGDLRRMREELGFEPRLNIRDTVRSFAASDRLLRLSA
jgi:UDP-glucose 4-epimerase